MPLIINGLNPLTLAPNPYYFDPGAIATDALGTDISDQIITVNNVIPSVPGTYTVTYSVDIDGVPTTDTRTVIITTIYTRQRNVITHTSTFAANVTGENISLTVTNLLDRFRDSILAIPDTRLYTLVVSIELFIVRAISVVTGGSTINPGTPGTPGTTIPGSTYNTLDELFGILNDIQNEFNQLDFEGTIADYGPVARDQFTYMIGSFRNRLEEVPLPDDVYGWLSSDYRVTSGMIVSYWEQSGHTSNTEVTTIIDRVPQEFFPAVLTYLGAAPVDPEDPGGGGVIVPSGQRYFGTTRELYYLTTFKEDINTPDYLPDVVNWTQNIVLDFSNAGELNSIVRIHGQILGTVTFGE